MSERPSSVILCLCLCWCCVFLVHVCLSSANEKNSPPPHRHRQPANKLVCLRAMVGLMGRKPTPQQTAAWWCLGQDKGPANGGFAVALCLFLCVGSLTESETSKSKADEEQGWERQSMQARILRPPTNTNTQAHWSTLRPPAHPRQRAGPGGVAAGCGRGGSRDGVPARKQRRAPRPQEPQRAAGRRAVC